MPQVVIIPPTKLERKTLRVAPYCRVSSDSDDQLHSYAAQIDYYTKTVNDNPDWVLVDIYADEGLSGMSMERRDDLHRLIADCKKGKIDKVLIKSTSRLARNTAECLQIMRDLKLMNVSVRSEKENFDTADMNSEMLLMIWSSHAQMESVSISQNMRWSYEKRMQSGEFITCNAPYGYELVEGKHLIPKEPEATIAKWIFSSYLSGTSTRRLASSLNERGLESPDNDGIWLHTAILYILKNEKYIGDSLAQKSYSSDTFPYKNVRNNGEKDQYYTRNTHPALITRETFEKAQELLKRRAERERAESIEYPLSRMISCGICGTTFKRRVTASGYVCWVCREHDRSKEGCSVPRIPEASIYEGFVRMANKLRSHSEIILKPASDQLMELQVALKNGDYRLIALKTELAGLTEQGHTLAQLRAKGILDEEIFIRNNNVLSARRAELRRQQRFISSGDNRQELIDSLRTLIETIERAPPQMMEFDSGLFTAIVERVYIDSASEARFRLLGGVEIRDALRRIGR